MKLFYALMLSVLSMTFAASTVTFAGEHGKKVSAVAKKKAKRKARAKVKAKKMEKKAETHADDMEAPAAAE